MIEITYKAILKLERIERSAERATFRVQRRSGALLRTLMRRSIRKRKKKKSAPGEVPFSHVNSSGFGLRSILYHYDPSTKTTIVGPIGGQERTGAPKALEFGGRSQIKLPPRLRRKLNRRTVSAHIKRRSFAGPALEAFATDYPDLWKDSIL